MVDYLTAILPALIPSMAFIWLKFQQSQMPFTTEVFAKEYDYIVVGAGSAGAVVANRLSENPFVSVLLLEAGGYETYQSEIPMMAARLQLSEWDWKYKTVPQKYACQGMKNHQSAWPRGKILGGCSSLNYMLYVRGNRKDYEIWERLGNPGWGYDDLFYYFIKSEDNRDPDVLKNGYHGSGGYLTVSTTHYTTPIAGAFLEAAKLFGYPNNDINGASQTGFVVPQGTIRRGARCSTSKAFLRDIRGRGLQFLVDAPVTVVQPRVMVAKSFTQWASLGIGPLTMLGGLDGIGFIHTKYSNRSEDWPDVEIHFIPSCPSSDGGESVRKNMNLKDELFMKIYSKYLYTDTYSYYPVLLRPKSVGYLMLQSANPYDPPIMDPKYLSHPDDAATLVDSLKICIKMALSKPFQKFRPQNWPVKWYGYLVKGIKRGAPIKPGQAPVPKVLLEPKPEKGPKGPIGHLVNIFSKSGFKKLTKRIQWPLFA
ncbi:Glucose dehydrogenase-like protein 2 [Leptotrombidium deliense]|uniref:Glucose dehydrogenase-like protein 2 n=1 Tax=Leptotrombidium deliense TaxID=299467 RepID=A0A443SWW3_9ACAR|nr:Glucose dehydrogenase-like protein 2 [Leptotrombidium deliense]